MFYVEVELPGPQKKVVVVKNTLWPQGASISISKSKGYCITHKYMNTIPIPIENRNRFVPGKGDIYKTTKKEDNSEWVGDSRIHDYLMVRFRSKTITAEILALLGG